MKRHIPNLLTLSNLLCGCIAVVFAMLNEMELTAFFVVLGIFFDFFDGFAARLLKVQSDLGLQLDSLADMVTSGVVPGIIMFQLMRLSLGNNIEDFTLNSESIPILPFLGFLITVGSGYRLANFNVDENQTDSFIGLPTPANTLLILSLPMILLYHQSDVLNGIILNPWFLVGVTLLSTYILNAKLPLFALKFKSWAFQDNALRYIFIIVAIVLLFTLKFLAIPIIISFYILSSLINNITSK